MLLEIIGIFLLLVGILIIEKYKRFKILGFILVITAIIIGFYNLIIRIVE